MTRLVTVLKKEKSFWMEPVRIPKYRQVLKESSTLLVSIVAVVLVVVVLFIWRLLSQVETGAIGLVGNRVFRVLGNKLSHVAFFVYPKVVEHFPTELYFQEVVRTAWDLVSFVAAIFPILSSTIFSVHLRTMCFVVANCIL